MSKPGLTSFRAYRQLHHGAGLCYYQVKEAETDLHIGSCKPLPAIARVAAIEARAHVTAAIAACPSFLTSFEPVSLSNALPVADAMLRASAACGVGPMAAVAGAIAAHVGQALLRAHCGDVIVENGGDIFLRCARPRIIAVYAGESPFTGRLALRVAAPNGRGLCTSAGRVGPSVSLGDADAMVILAGDAALADACATAAGNLVTDADSLHRAIAYASSVPGVCGALAIRGEDLAAWGEVDLVRL